MSHEIWVKKAKPLGLIIRRKWYFNYEDLMSLKYDTYSNFIQPYLCGL